MGYDDPISNRQLDYIFSLGRKVVDGGEQLPELELEDELNRMIRPVYECDLQDFNRGQAGMLIDTLRYESGESDEEPEHPSII